MAEQLHIVCHSVPYPPDHGGLTDLFYKIKWLHKLGVQIHLHCFTKGSQRPAELDSLCASVSYYPRKMQSFSFRVPFIVSSRSNPDLSIALQRDNHPVMLEGTHCTWPLLTGNLEGRDVFVRLHNVEHIYYRHLARLETNYFRRLFYSRESRLLKNWEVRMAASGAAFLPVSGRDAQLFQRMNRCAKVQMIPVFTGKETVEAAKGYGEYCLYHGNLSVNENEAAASWLAKNVFAGASVNLIIAGKDPSKRLISLASGLPNVHVVSNPHESSMNELIENAHIHVLPSLNKTGVKLKVLNALYQGRFVLTNSTAVNGTSVEKLCFMAESAEEFRTMVSKLMKEEYGSSHIRERNEVLQGIYNDEMNALHLRSLIFPHYPKPSLLPF